MQAFVDESGGKGHTRIFTMAAWMAPASQWERFNRQWRDCLAGSRPVDYLKMREAAALSGEFRSFSPRERDSKLRRLARVIRENASAAIACSTDLHAFDDTIATVGKPFSDPYFWPYHTIMMAMCLDLVERGYEQRMEVIFDDHVIFGQRARAWYPLVRCLMSDPAEEVVMPEEPRFCSDEDALPLQASDMLAWLIRRSSERDWAAIERWEVTGRLETEPPHSSDFAWLVEEELGHVPMSSQVQFMTRRRLEGIMDLMEQYIQSDFKDVVVPAGFLEQYREVLSS